MVVDVVRAGGGRCGGLRGVVRSTGWDRFRLVSPTGPWKPGEAGERGGDGVGPGPGLCHAQPGAASGAGDAGGDVQEPVAQSFRFRGGEFAVAAQQLGPGEQVDAG